MVALAKDPAEQNKVCTFDDGKAISLRYAGGEKESKLPLGQVWTPGNQPIYLFSQTPFDLGGSTLPAKAYRVFFIPGKENWTLIINEDVAKNDSYSKDHDVARVSMDIGKLSAKQPEFQLVLGHTAPKRCSIRVYYGSIGAFATFHEDQEPVR